MEMRMIYDKAEKSEECFLGLRNTVKVLACKFDKIEGASDSGEFLETIELGLNAFRKVERLKNDVLWAQDKITKQRAILKKKLKKSGRAIRPTTYYTRVNDRRKVLYLSYHIENTQEEHHLVVDSMFKIYIEKRLTTPALVINFSSLSELERVALEKNILID